MLKPYQQPDCPVARTMDLIGDRWTTLPGFDSAAQVDAAAGRIAVWGKRTGDTFNLDETLLEAAITPRTKAIMPVHIFGYPCDIGGDVFSFMMLVSCEGCRNRSNVQCGKGQRRSFSLAVDHSRARPCVQVLSVACTAPSMP